MSKSAKALKYISHGVYLQVFLGIGFILWAEVNSFFNTESTPPNDLKGGMGYILIGLAINSLIYINRYKKALKEENS